MDEEINYWIDNLSQNFSSKIKDIVNIWIDIGVVGEKLSTRKNVLGQHINELLDNMLYEENEHRSELKLNVKKINHEITSLSNILSIKEVVILEDSLIKNEQKSLSILEELCIIKNDRVKRFNDFINIEKELCEKLFEIRKLFNTERVQTEDELNQMNEYIQVLQSTKTQRQECFLKKRIQIVKYFQLIEKSISEDIFMEKILKDESAENVPLSEDFLKKCDDLIHKLSEEYEQNKNECIKLRNRYSTLYKILYPNISEGTYSQYASLEDFKSKTMEKLRCDVNLLEKFRLEKMEEFVKSYQNQIKDKLNNNFLSHLKDKEPHKSLLQSEIYNEDLLNKLELELNAITEVEKQVFPIQMEINNWNACFAKLNHLKLQMKDPNVLKNRGGILLRVEKENKAVTKELPKSEAKIESLLSSLKSDLILPDDLLIDQMRILDYLVFQWNNLDGEKENEKKNISKSAVTKSTAIQNKAPLSKINEVSQPKNATNKVLVDLSDNSQKKLPLSKSNEMSQLKKVSNSVLVNKLDTVQNKAILQKLNIAQLSNKSTDFTLKKTSIKIPQLKKIQKKQLPISPIQKIIKEFQPLNKRFSRSCNNLNTPIKSMTASSNNLYGMFCQNIEPGIATSSFMEHIPNRKY